MIHFLFLLEDDSSKSKLELLYIEYKKPMYRIAFSILNNQEDAEDAVHNSFLSIAKNIKKIGEVNSENTKLYLFRAAKNAAINIYHQNKKTSQWTEELNDNYCYTDEELDDKLQSQMQKEKFDFVVQCICQLPLIYRSVLEMHFLQENTINQTAQILGLSVSAVKQRLVRGKKLLMDLLEKGE